jgi:hypothetical protein
MSFVDDEENETALAGQVVEGGAELRQEAHETEGWFDLESEEDLTVEGRDAQVGIGEVDDGIEIAVEGLSESTDSGGLTSADVAGKEGRKAFLEGESQTALSFAVVT